MNDSEYEITDPNGRYGNNVICCNNKLFMGIKFYHMIYTFILLIAPTILFICVMIMFENYISSALSILITVTLFIVIIIMLICGGTNDPGIVERNHPCRSYCNKRNMSINKNGYVLQISFCGTCAHYRPPRTSHCAECDNCVERFDHHCFWMGTCVGKRNYKFFYFLVLSVNSLAFYEIFASIGFIVSYYQETQIKQANTAFIIGGLSSVIFFNIMFELFFLGKLLILHSRLLFKNVTFYEHLKKKYNSATNTNPYKRNALRNLSLVLCRKKPKPLLELDPEKLAFLRRHEMRNGDNFSDIRNDE